mgnify:CR=1 FL=1
MTSQLFSDAPFVIGTAARQHPDNAQEAWERRTALFAEAGDELRNLKERGMTFDEWFELFGGEWSGYEINLHLAMQHLDAHQNGRPPSPEVQFKSLVFLP